MNDYTFILHALLSIPEDDYHAASKRGEFLSSHMLGDFRNCPEYYHRKIQGEVPEKPSTAYALGSAAHKLILEGNIAFAEAYTVANGPINEKTKQPYGRNTKAYSEWLEHQEKPVLSPQEHEWLERLRKAVMSHKAAAKRLEQGTAEGVLRANLLGMPCQIRIDWFSPEFGIVDLKTAADLDWFESDIRSYGYIFQLAFYRAVVREATGITVPVSIIAVEKNEPFRAGVWELSPAVLDEAERINNAAIDRLLTYWKTNTWPTGFEEPRVVTTLNR